MASTVATKSKPTTENDDSKTATGVASGDRHHHSSDTVDNPALIHQPFVSMEELLEKLKLVNYDVDFCHAFHFKPISRCCSLVICEVSVLR